MNSRSLKWLYQELPNLVAQGIINQQQADRITQYYGQMSEAGKKKTFLIVSSVVGALLIGLGIISLIAHNWEQLGRPVRAVLSLLPMVAGIALTGWALAKDKATQAFKEASATFLTLMIGASIALISQTYNISGEVQSFILTWMLLAAPLVYVVTVTVPAFIFCIGITSWAIGYIWRDTSLALCYWPLIAVIIPHFIYTLRNKDFAVRATLLSSVLAVSCALYTSLLLFNIIPSLWVIHMSLLFAAMYLTGTGRFATVSRQWQQPFQRIGELGIIAVSLVATYRWAWAETDYWFFRSDQSPFISAAYLIAGVLLIVTAFLSASAIKEKRYHTALLGIVPAIAIIGFAFKPIGMILFNVYFFVFSLERIQRGVKENKLRVINEGLLLLAVIIAVRFFDSEINMVLKGLVMIALGAGFLVTNVVFIRRRGGSHE